MRGSRLLQVSSILLIIFGAINLVISVLSAVGFTILSKELDLDDINTQAIFFISIILLAVQLITGFIGAVYWNNPNHYEVCIIWGSILIVCLLFNNVINILVNDISWINIASGVLFPILYLIGAFRNKKLENSR